METYATIFFKNEDPTTELTSHVEKIATSEYDLSIEQVEEKNGFTVVSLLGGSDTEDGIESIMEMLHTKAVSLVKAYAIGDEDPWCKLFSIRNGRVKSVECADGIYEHISECDELEINASDELKEAHTKGPQRFFGDRFDEWKQGLEGQKLNQISSEISSIIESSS